MECFLVHTPPPLSLLSCSRDFNIYQKYKMQDTQGQMWAVLWSGYLCSISISQCMNRADKRHKITQLYRQASMLLCVRNTVILLRSTVEKEHWAHFTCAFCCHLSKKTSSFPTNTTKKWQSLNILLESTLSMSQRVPSKARSSDRIF